MSVSNDRSISLTDGADCWCRPCWPNLARTGHVSSILTWSHRHRPDEHLFDSSEIIQFMHRKLALSGETMHLITLWFRCDVLQFWHGVLVINRKIIFVNREWSQDEIASGTSDSRELFLPAPFHPLGLPKRIFSVFFGACGASKKTWKFSRGIFEESSTFVLKSRILPR